METQDIPKMGFTNRPPVRQSDARRSFDVQHFYSAVAEHVELLDDLAFDVSPELTASGADWSHRGS